MRDFRRAAYALSFLLSNLIALAAGLLLTALLLQPAFGGQNFNGVPLAGDALLVTLIVATFFTSLVLHELGHMIAGLLTGYRVSALIFFFIEAVREESGRWSVRLASPFRGAVTRMEPGPRVKDEEAADMINTAGGLVASLLVLAFSLIASLPLAASPDGRWLFWASMAIQNGVMLISGILPTRIGGRLSDGAILWNAAHGEYRESLDEALRLSAEELEAIYALRPPSDPPA